MRSLVIQLKPDAATLLAAAKTIPPRCLQAIARAHDKQNHLTIGHISKKYLSFPKDGPTTLEGLRVITNRLRKSLWSTRAIVKGTSVISSIGTNVRYARIHEEGGTVPPHTIRARRARALRFSIGGKTIFRRSVKHPGSKIPARAPIWRGITDCLPDYEQAISDAVMQSFPKGRKS